MDVVAAKVIIESAGGVTSDIQGNHQKYFQDINGFVATNNQDNHELFLKIINEVI